MKTHSSLDAVGERQSIVSAAIGGAGVDVWQGAATIIPVPDQTTGSLISILCANANDTAAGTGVRSVIIHYLDINWLEQTATVATNGGTVNTGITAMFINSAHSGSVGSGGWAAGNITVHLTGTAATVYRNILAGTNMDLTCALMVPASCTMLISGWTASASSTANATFVRLRATAHHNIAFPGIFIFQDSCTLEEGSVYPRKYNENERLVLPAKTIVKVSVWNEGAGANVASSIDGEILCSM